MTTTMTKCVVLFTTTFFGIAAIYYWTKDNNDEDNEEEKKKKSHADDTVSAKVPLSTFKVKAKTSTPSCQEDFEIEEALNTVCDVEASVSTSSFDNATMSEKAILLDNETATNEFIFSGDELTSSTSLEEINSLEYTTAIPLEDTLDTNVSTPMSAEDPQTSMSPLTFSSDGMSRLSAEIETALSLSATETASESKEEGYFACSEETDVENSDDLPVVSEVEENEVHPSIEMPSSDVMQRSEEPWNHSRLNPEARVFTPSWS